MNPKTDAPPRLALPLATGFGLGYLPLVPGTWGSLGGVVLTCGLTKLWWWLFPQDLIGIALGPRIVLPLSLCLNAACSLLVALVGVWASGHGEKHFGVKDPRAVVIDEVSGQQITYLFGPTALNWKYLLLGFILFRALDVWKPSPARQVESWRGGWGIMADDWFAGLYAALGLWLAKTLGW